MMVHMARLSCLWLLTLGVVGALSGTVKNTPAQTFKQCQKKTANPLDGCPPGTIYVSQTDKRAKFQTIQSAVSSLPNDTTSHSYADIDYDSAYENDVQIYWNAANHDAIFPDNVYTGVLTVGPNLNATLTGSGPTGFPVPDDTPFGCTDFRAYNIDFRNEYAPYSSGPAHAVGVSRANAGFYSCGFYSWQDTVYIGKLGNAYFHDSVVAGQTDFLYGFGTLFIECSSLSLRNCGGGITAWKGTNTTFANKYGVYISGSRVLAANSTVAPLIADKCSLGRPWNALHRSVYMNTYFDPSILPAGYTPWAGQPNGNIGVNTTMAVYRVYGPGYDEEAEKASNVTTVFGAKQAKPYLRPADVFMTPEGKQPNTRWIDPSVTFSRRSYMR
ncbi:carbohydrate esterase family 8 protein [Xylaria palmicola]|nr:carbohydrate esterase family 8 protein [Xylaria palmicola]